MRVVVKIGGSVVASPINPSVITQYVVLLEDLKKQGHDIVVVVGGGTYARDFIKAAKNMGLDEKAQDEIAISVSRLFVQLFLKRLGSSACQNIPLTVEDAASGVRQSKLVVMGGLKPGMTTDTVAALVAEETKADMVVKATDQDGIYDRDPRRYPDAVKLNHLAIKGIAEVLSQKKHKAGIHQIIDPEAARILRRLKIRMVVVNGFRPQNIMAAVRGEHVGTLID